MKISKKTFKETWKSLNQQNATKDDADARNDFWSIEGDFIYRHHVEPRVQLYVPKEETFPISLKYVDVTRTLHTNLDVLQESHISGCWNVDADRSLSDSWAGFTMFTLVNEKLPKAYMSSGVAKADQKKEKHEWAYRKTKAR